MEMDESSWPRCLLWHGWLPLLSGVTGGSPWADVAERDVWTDGSLVEDKMSGASSAGAGCFTYRCSRLWANWRWGHLDEGVGEDAVDRACRGFCSVPGPLQSVQRAQFWGVILALQANDGEHLGVDNLGVARHVGRLLDGKTASRPAEWVKDRDLLLLF